MREPAQVHWSALEAPRAMLGESPVWSVREQALYWVDIRAPALHRLHWATRAVETFPFDEVVGGVVLASDGSVVLAMKEGLERFDPRTRRRTPLVRLEHGLPENRLNEFKCDPRGHLWCGSMWDYGVQVRGALYRVDPGLRVQTLRTGVGVPNGLAFPPGDDRVFFADSQRGAIEVAHMDAPASGGALAWRDWVAADALPGRPDGATLDSEGGLWTARAAGGACVARIAPDGRVDRVFPLPVPRPTACAFGGPDLDILFVTTTRQRMSEAELAACPEAGHLLYAAVGWRGLPEPEFTFEEPL